jgi:hypothetical protein
MRLRQLRPEFGEYPMIGVSIDDRGHKNLFGVHHIEDIEQTISQEPAIQHMPAVQLTVSSSGLLSTRRTSTLLSEALRLQHTTTRGDAQRPPTFAERGISPLPQDCEPLRPRWYGWPNFAVAPPTTHGAGPTESGFPTIISERRPLPQPRAVADP